MRWLRDDLALGEDAHIASLVGNRAEAVECVLGAMCAGLWITPVNHHLRADEIAHVLADSGARVVLADRAHCDAARAAGATRIVCIEDELEAVLANGTPATLDAAGPAGGTMIYTSGTTGKPKGVRRTKPATLEGALACLAPRRHRDRTRRLGPASRDGPALSRRAAPLRDLRPC